MLSAYRNQNLLPVVYKRCRLRYLDGSLLSGSGMHILCLYGIYCDISYQAGRSMNLGNKMKSRDAKSNPAMAVFAAVFVMFILSGLLLLLLALLLYKMDLSESVVKIGIVVIYVISGIVGGFLMGKITREQKFLWGLAAGVIYFVILLAVSAVVKGGFEMELTKVAATLILCGASGMAGGMIS